MGLGFLKATLACPFCGASRVLKWFNLDKDGNYVGPEVRYDITYKTSWTKGRNSIFWETHVPSVALLQNLRAQAERVLAELDELIAERSNNA